MDDTSTNQAPAEPSLQSSQPGLSLIEEARKERESIEKSLAELKKQRAEFEQLHARQILGGTALAGSKIEPKTPEQLIEEQAEQMANDAVKRMLGSRGEKY